MKRRRNKKIRRKFFARQLSITNKPNNKLLFVNTIRTGWTGERSQLAVANERVPFLNTQASVGTTVRTASQLLAT